MFNKKRPVPSAAALRVLTQLAYVSSGTALGAAALCAEERRRRIKIVQKLADNARVIRQHPRHVSNVALAVNDNGESGMEGFFGSGGWSPEAVRRRSRQPRERGNNELTGKEDEGVKGPALPSVVEQGYADTVAREDADREDGGAQALNSPAYSPFGTSIAAMEQTRHGARQDQLAEQGLQISNRNNIPESTPKQTTAIHENTLFQSLRRDSRGMWVRERPDIPATASATSNPATKVVSNTDYNSAFAWRARDSLPLDPLTPNNESFQVSGDHITHDVELFFARETQSTLGHEPTAIRAHVSNQLLILALQKGSLDDIRSLCLWKLANGSFDPWHIDLVAKSSATLASRIDQEDLLEFFSGLFSSDSFKRLESRDRFRHQLQVLAAAASAYPYAGVKGLAVRLVGRTARVLTVNEVKSCLESVCRSLLDEGEASHAVRLFLMFNRASALFFTTYPDKKVFYALADDIIDRCIKSGQLSTAGRVLIWKHGSLSTRSQQRDVLRLQAFITACSVRHLHSILLDVFALGRQHIITPINVLVRYLDESSRVTLARAFSQEPRCIQKFNVLYHSLSREAQHNLNEHTSAAGILAKWQSTRDLSDVEAEAAIMKGWLVQQKDEQAMKNVDEAMLEIYITAGKTDRALDLLSRMCKADGIDGRTYCLAALLFAKRRRWDHLSRLLRIAEFNNPTGIDFESMRIWDKVVLLYSERHTAEQTLKFVGESVSSVGFAPTVVTGRVLLQSCINTRSLDIIPKCLDYLQSIGRQIRLNSRVVAGMMTTYWIKTRPKHKRLIWLCHFLHRHIPSLRAHDFKDLLKEAIGYDLRNPYEQDLSSTNLVEYVMARLVRLDGANGTVPLPGCAGPGGDRQLTFTREGGLFDGSVVRYLAATDGKAGTSDGSESASVGERSVAQGAGEVKEKNAVESNGDEDLSVSGEMYLYDKTSQTVHTPRDDIFGYDDIEDAKLFPGNAAARPWATPETTEEQYYTMIEEFNVGDADPNASQTVESDDTYAATERQIDEANRSFSHVRPNVEAFDSINDELQHATFGDQRSRERNMVLALSTRDYERVLQIYRDTITPTGLPASVRALEIATEAALRLHRGNPTEAEALLARASKAGMNVTCAMGPLIIHRMRNMSHFRKRDANYLRTMVMDYYRMNDENDWPVSHHIATTAAHLLITNNCPEHGVNLLTAVYTSEWVNERPLDTVAMTVFLMGYNDLKSLSGIQWVVDQILSNDLRVSRSFVRELKRSYTLPEETTSKSWRVKTRFTDEKDKAVLRQLAEKCYRRRLDQIHDDHQLGSQLETTIKECAKIQGLEVREGWQEREVYRSLVRGDLETEPKNREALDRGEDWVDGVSALQPGARVLHKDFDVDGGLVDQQTLIDGEDAEKVESSVAAPYTPFFKNVEDAPAVARPVVEATDGDGRKGKRYISKGNACRNPDAYDLQWRRVAGMSGDVSPNKPFA